MSFEQAKQPSSENPRGTVSKFVENTLKKGTPIGNQREVLIGGFCAENGVDEETARGLMRLVTKFDRLKNAADVEEVLQFALWLQTNVPEKFYRRNNLVYLADEQKPFHDFLESMKANYAFWTKVFGDKLFETSTDTVSPREGIWKSWLPLKGYYLSLKGGSGSGTFSVDIAIGYDNKHEQHTEPLHDTAGEIWRVGFDMELGPSGERMFRIIRTGSGHKSAGSTERAGDLKAIRKTFLEEYKASPQRLLLFLALEIAYTLGFDHIKALSSEGAMRLSTLRGSKTPLDYSVSVSDVGFPPSSKNWHEVRDWQHAIFEGTPFQGTLGKHEVRSLDAVERAFNSLRHAEGETLPLKIGNEDALEDPDPVRLERIWNAYARLHEASAE